MVDVSVFLNIGKGDPTLSPLHASISKEVLQIIASTRIASRAVDFDHRKVATTDRFTVYVPFPWPRSLPFSCMCDPGDHFLIQNQMSIVNTYTHGGGDVFYFTPSGLLMHFRATKRFTCPTDGHPLFLRASCTHTLKRCYNGSLDTFHTNKDIEWRLGIVNQLHYLDDGGGPDGDGTIWLWKWKGDPNNKEGCDQFTPQLMHAQSWEDLLNHMEYDKFCLQDIRLYYLNQSSSPIPNTSAMGVGSHPLSDPVTFLRQKYLGLKQTQKPPLKSIR